MTIKELYEYAKARGIENRPVVVTGYDGDLFDLDEEIIKEPSEIEDVYEGEIPKNAIVITTGEC